MLGQWLLGFCLVWGCFSAYADTTSSSSKSKNPTLRLGAVLALSGPEAEFGAGTRRGIELAVEEANAHGGVHGASIEVIFRDSRGTAEGARQSAQDLVQKENVLGIIGSVASSRSLAMASVAQRAHIPMVSPSSTHPKVTQVGDYIFRVCFIDPFQGEVMARYVKEVLNIDRVAILRNLKNDYSVSLANYFQEKFIRLGGTIVADQAYQSGDVDFTVALEKIREAKPGLIYLPGYYTEVGMIVGQARKLKITIPFAGGDGWDESNLFRTQRKILEGSYYSSHYWPHTGDPTLMKFVRSFRKRFGLVPDGLAALGYDATNVMLEGMRQAKAMSGFEIKKAIAHTKGYPGVTGSITLNENRDAIKPALIFQVAQGKRKYLQQIVP